MSVIRVSHKEANENQWIAMTESEAVNTGLTIIEKWKPQYEVMALKYGPYIPAMFGCLPGLVLINRLRAIHNMNRINNGRVVSSLAPVVSGMALPGMMQYENVKVRFNIFTRSKWIVNNT